MSHDSPGVGHNNPPEPTPFEIISTEIENLYLEAKNWCDGEPIENQAQADAVGKLIDMIRSAEKKADALRSEEKAPLDEQVKAIQARYAPLIADTKTVKGKTVLALKACKDTLAPYMRRQEQEREAAEKKAREEALQKQREAEEAARAAKSLEDREAAEAAIQDAKQAERTANRLSSMTTKAGSGVQRRVGLRTYYDAQIVDERAFARFVWQHHLDDLRPALQSLAQQYVNAKRREIPGVNVVERKDVA